MWETEICHSTKKKKKIHSVGWNFLEVTTEGKAREGQNLKWNL